MRALRTILILGGGAMLGSAAVVFAAHWWIQRAARRYVIGAMDGLPPNHMGLVLGTSARGKGRARNPHFEHRIAAAAALFHAGRVEHLLLSGNGAAGSAEPADMQRALAARGVPAADTTLDNAGFRTLDSMVRAKEVFGLRRLTIVTDGFHCARAVFLARHFGLEAVAFPSPEVVPATKSRRREWLADVRACLDVYVLRTKPALGAGKPARPSACSGGL